MQIAMPGYEHVRLLPHHRVWQGRITKYIK